MKPDAEMSLDSFSHRAIWRLLGILVGFEVILVALNSIDLPAYILTRSFNLDAEANIPTWFSSIQLFSLGCVCVFCFQAESEFYEKKTSLGWILLALVFWGLSVDEVATLHELIGKSAAKIYDLRVFRIGGFVWVYIFSPFAIFVGGYLAYFFYRRLRQVKTSMFLCFSGLLLWLLVLPMEYMGGRMADLNIDYWKSSIYKTLTNFEEFSEMAGASLMLAGILFYMKASYIANLKYKLSD